MISLWDSNENNTLRIDLWTKDMMVDEMKQFYHQCLLSMADTFERATGETESAKEMRTYAQHFAEKLKLIEKKNEISERFKEQIGFADKIKQFLSAFFHFSGSIKTRRKFIPAFPHFFFIFPDICCGL
jgi:hypothetical protein